MARKHIYDRDLGYTLLRPWADWGIRFSYLKAEVRGKDNVPEDGAVIICPNHCNTLMDALVMLRAYKGPTVFGARADIFRKPLFAKLLYFCRLVPIVRQRDGIRNVLQNKDTQKTIVETIENGVRFCIFAEGKHRTMHSLMTLGKGAIRIALEANEKFGTQKPVYLVPAGIEYGDYFRYHTSALVVYGDPVNVTEFVKENQYDNEAQLIDALRKELAARISKLITYIPDNENYEATWTLTKMLRINGSRKMYGRSCGSLFKAMTGNREAVAEIESKISEKPEQMRVLLDKVNAFEKSRKDAKVSIFSFRKKCDVWNALYRLTTAVLGLPYFIYSAVTSLPLWAIAMKLRSGMKDPAFGNTASFGIKLGVGTILFILYTVLAFCLAPWWLALTLILLWIPSYSYFHDYIEGCRITISDIRLIFNKTLKKNFNDIIKDYGTL